MAAGQRFPPSACLLPHPLPVARIEGTDSGSDGRGGFPQMRRRWRSRKRANWPNRLMSNYPIALAAWLPQDQYGRRIIIHEMQALVKRLQEDTSSRERKQQYAFAFE